MALEPLAQQCLAVVQVHKRLRRRLRRRVLRLCDGLQTESRPSAKEADFMMSEMQQLERGQPCCQLRGCKLRLLNILQVGADTIDGSMVTQICETCRPG